MITEFEKEILNKTTQKKTVPNSEIAIYSNETVIFKKSTLSNLRAERALEVGSYIQKVRGKVGMSAPIIDSI